MLFKLSCSIDLFKIFASINALKFSFAAYTRYITNIKQIITNPITTSNGKYLIIAEQDSSKIYLLKDNNKDGRKL